MIRINCFAISLDGYGAGRDQSLKNPLGVGGEGLHRWFVPTRTFQTMVAGKQQGTTGLDDEYARRGGLSDGQNLLMLALGGGMGWGSTLYTWAGPRTIERARAAAH